MAELVLNVDDYEPQRHARSAVLRAAGLAVIEAATGREALALARQHRPALVLLDVHLPEIDGLEVCRTLKADASLDALVLQISATFNERAQALDNGADVFLAEPVEPAELLAQVKAMLRLAVTERESRRVREALQESRARLRSFFDAPGVLMTVVELEADDLVYTTPNASLASFFGMTPQELSGKRAGRDLGVPPDQVEGWLAQYRRCLADGRPLTWEYRFDLGEHSGFYQTTISQIEGGTRPCFATTIVDVTKRRFLEEQLRSTVADLDSRVRELQESETRYRIMGETVPYGVWMWDPDGRTRYVSDSFLQLLGLSLDEVRQEGLLSRLAPEEVEAIRQEWRRCTATGEAWNWEFRFKDREGTLRTVLSRGLPVRSQDGAIANWVGVNLDITDRRRVELALHEARRLAEARESEIASIYDAAPIGLCIFDREGRYLRINKRLAEINGVPAKAHFGRTIREVVPGIADQAEALLREVVETNRPALGVEIVGEAPSMPGVTRTWLENWFPVRNADGEVVGVNVAAEEITELKRVQEQLEQANRIKDDFLATLSHELRTPLTAILGWASLLAEGRLDGHTARQALDAILRNAEIQRQLVTDVLDVSRMMAGKVRLELGEVDPLEVVNRAVASVRHAMNAKQIRLEVRSNTVVEAILADSDRLHQVFWNLVANAVKFTPEKGEIRISLHAQDGELRVAVEDSGEGISPEFLPKVFERFAQADTSVARRHAGLGLGLAIVKDLVELHGGRVEVFSAGKGQGATFTVTLPMVPVDNRVRRSEPQRSHESQAPGDLRGTRVLVVDDVRDTRDLLRTIVEGAGGTVVVADSGQAALAMLALWRPNVILADLGMPEMSGYDFIEQLRVLPVGTAREVPVIALTAYSGRRDRERTLRSGFAEHLSKPIIPHEVVAALVRVTAHGGAVPPQAQS